MTDRYEMEELLESVIPMIHRMATDFENKGLVGPDKAIEAQDLVQVGLMTAHVAAEKYNPDRGVKFSTYVFPALYRAMAEEVRKLGSVMSIPQKFAQYVISAVANADNRLTQEWGDVPTLEELLEDSTLRQKIRAASAYKSISPQKLDEHIKSAVDYLGGLGVYTFDDEDELIDTLPDESLESDPEHMTEQSFFSDTIIQALQELPENQREVLELRFGIADGRQWTLRAVGERMGLTGERIRQLEHRALQTLRHLPIRYELKDYL